MKKEKDTKEFITEIMKQLFTTARISVEAGNATQEEIDRHIAEEGKRLSEKINSMSKHEFAMWCFEELLRTTRECEEMKRKKE